MADAQKEIEDWLGKTGMKPSRLGSLSCANPRAVEGIRSGNGTIKNLNRVLLYIRTNPDGEPEG